MLLDAAAALGIDLEASWMIGDTDTDVTAGQAAGCRTVLIKEPASAHKRDGGVRPDAIVSNLSAAATLLVREE
jgi:phosphoglycolate phosphatase-like HAD superfamily hydrolase